MSWFNNIKANYKFTSSVLHINIRITYSDSVFVDFSIRNAMHMYHTVICKLHALHYFSTLSLQQHEFEINLLNIKCVF